MTRTAAVADAARLKPGCDPLVPACCQAVHDSGSAGGISRPGEQWHGAEYLTGCDGAD